MAKLLRHSVTNVETMQQTKLIESAELRIHDEDDDDDADYGIGIANGIVNISSLHRIFRS